VRTQNNQSVLHWLTNTQNQKLPSHLDFPIYKTSSKIVKPSFDQYDWHIVAEFFRRTDAYDFEQELIFENWANPLLLNKVHHYRALPRWSMSGTTMSEEQKAKIGLANKGRQWSNEHKANISAGLKLRALFTKN